MILIIFHGFDLLSLFYGISTFMGYLESKPLKNNSGTIRLL